MRVRWPIRASDIDNYDRSKDKAFEPYKGPQPPLNAVYPFRIKLLKYIPETDEKNAQLRIGLELAPQRREHNRYEGYFVMDFPPITGQTNFRYVKYLDALGVSATDFTDRTVADNEGNITRIGRWRNDGETLILVQLKPSRSGGDYPEVGWVGPYVDEDSADGGDDGDVSETESDDDYDEPVNRRVPRVNTRTTSQSRRRQRTRRNDDDEF